MGRVVHAEHAACEFLVLGINGCNEDRAFTVRHFAGDVEYAVDDFLKKNAETMEVMTRQLLATPALAFLQSTYDDAEETRLEASNNQTPAQLAELHGIDLGALLRANAQRHKGIKANSKLKEGTDLVLPSTGKSPKKAPKAAAKAPKAAAAKAPKRLPVSGAALMRRSTPSASSTSSGPTSTSTRTASGSRPP